MFPIRDSAGRVVGFTGRILPEADPSRVGQAMEVAKYLNSPETAVFNKSRILYGFDLAKLAIKKFDYSVIVEGQMDIIMCHQAGFQNVVATSGTALTPEHLTLLRRISNRVIMAFDADKAGLNAATKAWQLALSLGMEVKIAEFKDGKDPADIILGENGKEKFKEALKDSMHIVDFYLSKIMADGLDPRKTGAAVREKILPFLALIESNIEKSHFVKKIADKTGIDETAIWEDLKKIKVEPGADGAVIKSSLSSTTDKISVSLGRIDSIERRVIGIINWQEKSKASSGEGGEKILDIERIKERTEEIIGKDNFTRWLKAPEQILNEITFEAEQYYDKKKLSIILDELLLELEKEYVKRDLSVSMNEMIKAEKEKDYKRRDILAKKCNDLTKKLSKLK
jgi:DNA primase